MSNTIVPPRVKTEMFPGVFISEGNGRIKTILQNGFSHFGGIQNVVKPGQSVFIKINLVEGHEAITGGITDVHLCEALVELIKDNCQPGTITVGEQTSSGTVTQRTFESGGWTAMCKRQGIELLDFEYGERVDVDVPDPMYMNKFNLPKILLDADVYISLPLLKNHDTVCVTASIKNTFGCVEDSVRRQCHRDMAIEQTITDLAKIRTADFVIVDGRIGMEGIAGGSWFEHPRYANRIVMGNNAVAVDTVCAHIMEQNPRVRYLQWCNELGLGPNNIDWINIFGMSLEEAKVKFMSPADELEELSGGKFHLIDAGSCSQCRAVAQGTLHRFNTPESVKKNVDIIYGPGDIDVDSLRENVILIGDCIQERYRSLGKWIPGCPMNRDTYMQALAELDIVCTDCLDCVKTFIANHTEDELAFIRIVSAGNTVFRGKNNKSGDMDSALCIGVCEQRYAQMQYARVENVLNKLEITHLGIDSRNIVGYVKGCRPSQEAIEAEFARLVEGRADVERRLKEGNVTSLETNIVKWDIEALMDNK